MTTKQPTSSTQRIESPNNGDKLPLEAPTDQWGETHEDRDRYPEGTPAREGETTAPSGQGGSSPHDGTSYQDQFPPNPEPSEWTRQWGEYLEQKARAEAKGEEPPEAPTPSAEPVKKGTTSKTTTTTTKEQPKSGSNP